MTFPNWFSITARANFEKFLTRDAGYIDFTKPIKAVQIGVFTGDATDWMIRNLLTPQGSWVSDVDTWLGSGETAHEGMDFAEVENEYIRRVVLAHTESKAVWNRAVKFKMTSNEFFEQNPEWLRYNFIYIDGDHHTQQVFDDAANSDAVLEMGGVLAFDDFTWGDGYPAGTTPRPAIEEFMSEYGERYETLGINAQVWLRKIA